MTTTTQLRAELKALMTSTNLQACTRCEGTGRYGGLGRCYSCRGSGRTLRRSVSRTATRLRKRIKEAERQELRAARTSNDAVLAGMGITWRDVQMCRDAGLARHFPVISMTMSRYAEGIPFTPEDVEMLTEIAQPPF